MVDMRIKPQAQQDEEAARRAEQKRVYQRNQMFGLLLVAVAVILWTLFHTKPGWIFPAAWWRP